MRFLHGVALLGILVLGCSESSSPGGVRDAGRPGSDAGGVGEDAGAGADGGSDPRTDGGPPDGGAMDPDSGVDGGSAGSDSGVDGGGPCPETGCDDVTVMGIDVNACCPSDGSGCGYDLRPVAAAVGLDSSAVSCVATDQPGVRDTSCPSRVVLGIYTLPGCCRPSGECGYEVELMMSLGFPDLGCIEYDNFSSAGTPDSCTP